MADYQDVTWKPLQLVWWKFFEPDYLKYRIRSTQYLGEKILKKGVPIIYPVGGHAVYVDAKKLYPHIPIEQYPGQALVCELYRIGGVRTVEIGSVMFVGKTQRDLAVHGRSLGCREFQCFLFLQHHRRAVNHRVQRFGPEDDLAALERGERPFQWLPGCL